MPLVAAGADSPRVELLELAEPALGGVAGALKSVTWLYMDCVRMFAFMKIKKQDCRQHHMTGLRVPHVLPARISTRTLNNFHLPEYAIGR